jgi:hypothetical protein
MHSSVHIFLMLNGKIVLAPGHEPDCPQNLYCVQSFPALQYYTCILYHWSLYCTISSRYALLYYPCISIILASSPLFGNIYWREVHFCVINSENCKAWLRSKMYNILFCVHYFKIHVPHNVQYSLCLHVCRCYVCTVLSFVT